MWIGRLLMPSSSKLHCCTYHERVALIFTRKLNTFEVVAIMTLKANLSAVTYLHGMDSLSFCCSANAVFPLCVWNVCHQIFLWLCVLWVYLNMSFQLHYLISVDWEDICVQWSGKFSEENSTVCVWGYGPKICLHETRSHHKSQRELQISSGESNSCFSATSVEFPLIQMRPVESEVSDY